jgi:hypothetical protein
MHTSYPVAGLAVKPAPVQVPPSRVLSFYRWLYRWYGDTADLHACTGYYAKKQHVSERTVYRWLACLRSLGYIQTEVTVGVERRIVPIQEPPKRRRMSGVCQGSMSGVSTLKAPDAYNATTQVCVNAGAAPPLPEVLPAPAPARSGPVAGLLPPTGGSEASCEHSATLGAEQGSDEGVTSEGLERNEVVGGVALRPEKEKRSRCRRSAATRPETRNEEGSEGRGASQGFGAVLGAASQIGGGCFVARRNSTGRNPSLASGAALPVEVLSVAGEEVKCLCSVGLAQGAAVGLVQRHGLKAVREALAAYRAAKDVRNPVGWLMRAVERRYEFASPSACEGRTGPKRVVLAYEPVPASINGLQGKAAFDAMRVKLSTAGRASR